MDWIHENKVLFITINYLDRALFMRFLKFVILKNTEPLSFMSSTARKETTGTQMTGLNPLPGIRNSSNLISTPL